MPDDFVPLAVLLGGGGPDAPAADRAASAAAVAEPVAGTTAPATPAGPPPAAGVGAELARLHLAATEALERRAAALLEGLARDVLARELLLAPVDLRALAAAALAAFRDEVPFAFAVSPEDAERFDAALPVRTDPSLRSGDLIVEVRDGALESHLSFRLASVVRRVAYDGE